MKAYLASGWFSTEQEQVRLMIKECLDNSGIEYYSPKDDGPLVEGLSRKAVFEDNLEEIQICDFIIASTEGKDMGTLFECGYAFCLDKPIVYVWLGQGPLNLMLSESATFIATTQNDLETLLWKIENIGFLALTKSYWGGEVE